MVYLDNAATTQPKPKPVIDAVTSAMNGMHINAGRGGYALARQASATIDACKEKLLRLAQIRGGYHVYFAPSATVAMNQLIFGLSCGAYTNAYVSPFEHNASMRPLEALCQQRGVHRLMLPFHREDWAFDKERCSDLFLKDKPDYVIVSMVSNTTGYVLPVREIVAITHSFGGKVIVDCAQALGSIEVDLSAIGADAYVFAGHKTLYGPFGVAGMILSDAWRPQVVYYGGTGTDSLSLKMPPPEAGGYEPASPNMIAIAGLEAAIDWICQTSISQIAEHERRLVDHFIKQAKTLSKVQLYLPPFASQSGIVAFNVEGYQSYEIGEILDEEFGICLRTGYQCAPFVHSWLGANHSNGLVRMSVSYFSTQEDISRLVKALETL